MGLSEVLKVISMASIGAEAQGKVALDYKWLCKISEQENAAPLFRLWANHRSLVVGKSVARQATFEATKAHFEQRGIPVVARDTGGTIVPHGPGVLNVSVLRQVSGTEKSVADSYMLFCNTVNRALNQVGITATVGSVPGSYCDGDYNIVAAGKKLAGTAQRWRKCKGKSGNWVVLVHASIVVEDEPADDVAILEFYRLMGWHDPFDPSVHTSCRANLPAAPSLAKGAPQNHAATQTGTDSDANANDVNTSSALMVELTRALETVFTNEGYQNTESLNL